MSTAELVWQGNAALEPLLVPLEELRPHERNPRRGDIATIRESLRRFGQQRPLLALADGTIVAGNHTFHALAEEGWSHAAVVRSQLEGREVEAYLLADNRTSDLGVYDDRALAGLLEPFRDAGELAGIGYSEGDVAELLAIVGALDWGSAAAGLSGEREPFQQMTFTLHDEQVVQVEAALRLAAAQGPFNGTGNENRNGNALARVCAGFLEAAEQ